MPVVDLTPHRLSYLISGNGYEDDNGDWHEGSQDWSRWIRCHAVAAGSANTIAYSDGTTSTYSYTIGRLPHDIRDFKVGEIVRLDIFGCIREFSVKGFHRYQLQSKIWV